MNSCVFTIKDIVRLVKPIAEKYGVKAIYLFGSYARGEAVCCMKYSDQQAYQKDI